ncbi:MAG: TonB-dependent receptor [Chitinophagaceae bacterium]|nr:TonB-dependent receptor [Chitinophagaceae bacterium]
MKKAFLFTVVSCMAIISYGQVITLTQTVKGAILDDQSGNYIANATITIEGKKDFGAVSDSLGFFWLRDIPVGRQTLRISAMGYDEIFIRNVEVTSSKEVFIEVRLKERIRKLEEVVVKSGRSKSKSLNESALVSARQFSVDEAVRYAGTRNDPSRMAQNFAGVSGSNDARNDIIIRGNSPAGVLWRMEGIDIPNPNHYSTLGSTGGPVTILNTNTLKNSDFLTSAFPAQYGNAIAGVFDLRMRNGNSEKYEFLAQAGFNGFEGGVEGPLSCKNKSSFLVNYRYSLVAVIQRVGLDVGTGSATPYYQDLNFKIHLPTRKLGVFNLFGLGGESNIKFGALDEDNLYSTNDGTLRDRNFNSLTGVIGLSHTFFFDQSTSGKLILAASAFGSKYREEFYDSPKPDKTAFFTRNTQIKYSVGYSINKKIDARNQLTAALVVDLNRLNLRNDYIPDGDSILSTLFDSKQNAALVKGSINFFHRFTDRLSTNLGLYSQHFSLNNSWSVEPRWNLKYQLKPAQSITFGLGLHSQTQPLEVYFYQSQNASGLTVLTNKDLGFVRSAHGVAGYDINLSSHLRVKAEVYGQYIWDAAVETNSTSFSMLNAGADFYFPNKTSLRNRGEGYNYGVELTLERFLNKGFYFLLTSSAFQSKYMGSDGVWRNTAFNSNFAMNLLAGKEFRLTAKTSFALDTKIAFAGGQRYTPFDISASYTAGYVVLKDQEAYGLQHPHYLRWDFKLSFNRNGPKATQKWYLDLQNLTNRDNIYVRTLNPRNGKTAVINQIGFFPNINYVVTF